MDSEGIVKSVDGIYKNILDKFEPSAKHVIQSSKSYLKSLQSVSTASKNFIESLAKLGVNARDGGASDIGNALLDFVEVFSSIEEKHTNILKAFYVDFILPLENNIEKDTKVIHLEQKKFVQLHKQRVESFNKATSAMKKHRKKKNNAEKELKCIQTLEEEKKYLDNFCEMSVRNAKIQERRRYGFILERCVLSMAKHWSQFFSAGQASIGANIDWWMEVAKTREMLPSSNDMATLKRPPIELKVNASVNNRHSNAYDDYGSVKSYIRKSQSHHGSFLEVEPDIPYPSSASRAPRAMSEQSLTSSQVAGKSSSSTAKEDSPVTAIFEFVASAENQLNFHEGDKIQVIGEMTQGWQFGENLRTNQYGWFPVSYVQTESERKSKKDDKDVNRMSVGSHHDRDSTTSTADKYQNLENPPMERAPSPPTSSAKSSVRHGSSTLNFSKQGQHHERSDNKQPPANTAIYSSNDSGFSNENLPPVDYSDDDDHPKKVPISRDEKIKMKNAMASSDNEDDYSKIPMKQSSSFGNLIESRAHGSSFNVDTTTMKRNKSFWRFSKSEDILMEGMALWKHRDLVPIDGSEFHHSERAQPPPMLVNRVDEATLKKQDNKNKKTNTLQTKADKALSSSAKKSTEKNKSSSARNMSEKKSNSVEQSKHSEAMVHYKDAMSKYDDDDNIYDESPKKRNDIGPSSTMQKRSMQQPPQPVKPVYGDRKKNFHRDSSLQETNFYEDDVFVMKTVKRKEILKQYYSSGTDTELSSSDPYDPYDCIIVDDHQLAQAQQSTLRNRNSYAAETSESLAKAYQQQRQQQQQQQRASKTESLSGGTLLPRTKLSKSVRSETNDFDFSDRISTTRSNKIASKEKWTNLWSE